MRRARFFALKCLVALGACASVGPAPAPTAPWRTITSREQPTPRHEAGMIAYRGKLYLLGGRGIKPVDVYDPATQRWTKKAMAPREFHHFQPVVHGNAIYIIGALQGRFNAETPFERILIYYPETDQFVDGPEIPVARRRGAGGTAVHRGKIYWVGGNTNGHIDGHQAWTDRFDLTTKTWEILPDAPESRDHFQAEIVGDRLYAFGGRKTEHKTRNTFNLVVRQGDVLDLRSQRWERLGESRVIPTSRAGLMSATWGRWIIYGGGESGERETAHDEVEAFDTRSQTWTSWPKFQRGRHGTGFAVAGNKLMVAAGSGNRGGRPELDSLEVLDLPAQ